MNEDEERDISEVYKILTDLSDHEMQRLEDAIAVYTEEEKEEEQE
jgi:hypothetical protein